MTLTRATRVCIVGGGPAGAVAALTLARAGFSPLVLEGHEGPRAKVGECLPPNSNTLLRRLGLVGRVAEVGIPCHGNRFVWGSAEPAERDFIFGAAGAGLQLDRRGFERELARAASEAGAGWNYGRRLTGCSRDGRGWKLEVNTARGPETYRADFVIDATGRASRLARMLGARRIRYDRLVAVASYFGPRGDADEDASAEVEHSNEVSNEGPDSFTLVEAVADGWWYSARLPGGRSVAVYMTDGDLLERDAVRGAEGFGALLERAEHTRRRVGALALALSPRPRVFAAHTSRLSTVAGEGWLAAGDAAVAHDPLASYGITAAMGAGVYAAAAAADYLGVGGRDATHVYARLIDNAFAHYLVMRHDRYMAERRWPASAFWRRRHAPATDAGADDS